MKDSGIAWIGEIPETWTVKKIKYVSSLASDKNDYQNGPYIGLEDIESWTGRILSDDVRESIDSMVTSYTNQSVLFGKLRPYLAKVALPERSGQCSTEILAITPDASMQREYFGELLLCEPFIDMVNASTYGAKMPRAEWTFIGNSYIPVPSLDEQEKIASAAERIGTKLQHTIEETQKLIDKLTAYKQSLITEAVTKGLHPEVARKDSGVSWIGEIPRTSIVVPLTKKIAQIVDYRGKTPEKVNDGIFLVTAKNIKDGIIDYALSQEYIRPEDYDTVMSRGKPKIGDVLFTTEAPLGEVANVDREDIALAQRVIKFTPTEEANPYYLKYWMMHQGFQQFLQSLSTGSTAAGIKASKLFMLKMVLHPLDEQRKIVSFLDAKCAAIDADIARRRKLIERLSAYRRSLIYEVVTGKREVAGD